MKPFNRGAAAKINAARQQHLGSLGLDLNNKRVLEVGSGIGLLTGFFEKRGCLMISTEGRPENVQEHLRRHPHRKGRVEVVDLMRPDSHVRFGQFDIVFCYGTLYHTLDPALVLGELARVCDGLFLLSGFVYPIDDGKIHLVREHGQIDQALHKFGCRPARNWLMSELQKHYGYVYLTKTQPDHPAYVLEWPSERESPRAVFVGSRQKLNLPTLSLKLLMKQERFQC